MKSVIGSTIYCADERSSLNCQARGPGGVSRAQACPQQDTRCTQPIGSTSNHRSLQSQRTDIVM